MIVRDTGQFSTLLNYELHSANRYRRFLSVVVVGAADGLPLDVPPTVQEAAREVDVLLEERGRWTILMPETDARGVRVALERYLGRCGSFPLRYGSASFPADGLEKDELMTLALKRLESARQHPSTVAVAEGAH